MCKGALKTVCMRKLATNPVLPIAKVHMCSKKKKVFMIDDERDTMCNLIWKYYNVYVGEL